MATMYYEQNINEDVLKGKKSLLSVTAHKVMHMH